MFNKLMALLLCVQAKAFPGSLDARCFRVQNEQSVVAQAGKVATVGGLDLQSTVLAPLQGAIRCRPQSLGDDRYCNIVDFLVADGVKCPA
jgi:hypothetical protein